MAVVRPENPAKTSAILRTPTPSLSYPLNESLSSMTRFRFVKYDRFNPWDPGSEEETATITLPLPITVPENYSINTSQMDLGNYGMLNDDNWKGLKGATNGSVMDILKQLTNSGISAMTDITRHKNFGTAAALGLAGILTSGAPDTDIISSFTGVVTNPHTTIVFNGVNLRNINLEWRFSARSEQESRALRNIYDQIKLCAHPPEIASGFALNYPDLVYIEFEGKVKDYMPKFQRAFINNINITPDSNNGMPLFKSGAPAIYSFQISATEISILTRDRLQEQISGESTNLGEPNPLPELNDDNDPLPEPVEIISV